MALTAYNKAQIIRRLTEGESIRTVAHAVGCGVSTVQRLKNEHNISTRKMNTPVPKMNTVKMTCEEYAEHMGEDYDPFKHGYGTMRSVELPT